MDSDVALQKEIDELTPSYISYCESEYRVWKKANPVSLPAAEGNIWFDRMERRHRKWREYIKEKATVWWEVRGYRIEITDKLPHNITKI